MLLLDLKSDFVPVPSFGSYRVRKVLTISKIVVSNLVRCGMKFKTLLRRMKAGLSS